MENENTVVRLCSTVTLDSADVDILNEIVNENLDWAYIVELSSINRVFPLLYKNLKTHCPAQVPPSVLQELRTLCLTNGVRNLRYLATLFSVVDVLKSRNIDVLVFKGPALAADVYGDIGLRSFGDLDLLLSRDDLPQAIRLLQNEGFTMDIDLSIEQYEKLVDTFHHAVMIKDAAAVELHWELSGRYFSKPVRFEDLAGRAEVINLDGRRVTTLGPEDLLVYLCLHGCRHFWVQLESVCSVNELIRKKREISWDRVLEVAQSQGAKKMLLLGVHLAQRLFGVELPETVKQELSQYPRLAEAADWVLSRMWKRPEGSGQPGYWQSVKYHYFIMDNTIDWVRYALKPVFNPTHSDWHWVKLPASLSMLHYLLRPVRLLWKYCRKVVD